MVLVGPPGAGKSTIGRKLARELGLDLYDTDAGIEEQTGRTIPEIFAEDGEPEFRRIEEQVVRDAVLAGHGIISLGGGSVLSAATRELLRGRTVVYLEISVGEGLRRTGASSNRPLLNGDDPAKKYRELMKIRRPLYRDVATVRVRTDGRSPGRVVRMILTKLGLESALPEELPTPEPITPPAEGASRSRSRRRRRRGRGRGDAEPATKATAAESDTTTGAPAADGDSADQQDAPKRRRSRRSRRRGRASDTAADTLDTTTSTPAATAGTGIAPTGGGTAPTANGGVDSSSAQHNAAAPASADPGGSVTDTRRQSASGTPAAPGAGRSRRARARRARARARQQSTEQGSPDTSAAPAPSATGSTASTAPAPAHPNPAPASGAAP
ncbi:shikimate kinase [Nocardia sp. 2]|uniref:Shikimate kinase n=1 Tax=Nocardia acididurans TaxID=2802282 RepID=A0ABS1M7P3_9NOCA|nr:shikimate kinase [Nocardia acididurans]